MQAEPSATPIQIPHSRSLSYNPDSSAQATSRSPPAQALQAYSFPAPPRTASADEHLQVRRETASASPALGEYARPSSRYEASFSYAAPRSDDAEEHYRPSALNARQYHPATMYGLSTGGLPEGYQQPRSLSNAGLPPLDEAQLARISSPSCPASMAAYDYDPRERTASGESEQRGPPSFTFPDYASHPAQYTSTYLPPHPLAQSPQSYLTYRPYPTSSSAGHPLARGGAAYNAGSPPPTLEWAKPRGSGEESSNHASRSYASSFASTSRYQTSSAHADAAVYYQHAYMMARSSSNQSGLSSYTESTESSHQSHSTSSEYEGHINPAFVNAAGRANSDSCYIRSGTGGLEALHLNELDKHEHEHEQDEYEEERPKTRLSTRSAMVIVGPTRRTKQSRDATIRGPYSSSSQNTLRALAPGSSSSTATASSGSNARRRISSNIYHPTPQSMLAPGVVAPSAGALAAPKDRDPAVFPGTNSSSLPSNEDFARMPTKRSRGRRPPCTPDLDLDPQDLEDPEFKLTEAQIAYAGVTKTGKPKKIFVCRVPGCGKLFRRSEHLKRHVRSIHTNERPFQCRWPGCERRFTRHDNLWQHLRVHRDPSSSDAEFSAAIQRHFGENGRGEIVKQESREESHEGEYEGEAPEQPASDEE
ncbi:proteophosphoglycan ppg4 [Rhodotorula toruloides]|uniref:Proteophosphoglycan ppg4 n=1 Tax=Rhodotorula toruloides TaxID=5286 RepID=A0A511KAM9_RHOTO|nr:proteophosphoglycan ppg4 [Rhodotorula toruloides]